MSLADPIECEWCGEELHESDDADEVESNGERLLCHAHCARDAVANGWTLVSSTQEGR